MKILTAIGLIGSIIVLSGCVTTVTDTQRSDYADHAPEIMAYVAQETGQSPAKIPSPQFQEGIPYGAAFYQVDGNIIILPAEWEPDLEGLSSLVHEFTHAIQHHNAPHVQKQQRAWFVELQHGNTDNLHTFADTALATCLDWETEAYMVSLEYRAKHAPKATKTELMGISKEDAVAIWAKSSCAEVQKWNNNLDAP